MLTSIRSLCAASLLAGGFFTATVALADEAAPPPEFAVTGSVAVVSQYRFRGISQSDNKPAIQGSITLKHKSGFYLSTWGSSTSGDFTNTPVAPGGTEIDVYGGYTHTFKGGLTIDMGGYGYLYPQGSVNDYYEVYGSVAQTLGPVTAKAGINYAPGQDYFKTFGVTNHNVYVYGELSGGIPKTPISLHGHLGYTDGGLRYLKNYIDYTAGVTYTWKNLALDASVVGTNVSDKDVLINTGCLPSCSYWKRPAKTVAVVSLTASF